MFLVKKRVECLISTQAVGTTCAFNEQVIRHIIKTFADRMFLNGNPVAGTKTEAYGVQN